MGKLPFDIKVIKKYDDLNIDEFLQDYQNRTAERKSRSIQMQNDIHLQLGKFITYGVSKSQVIDLALRYALTKQDFKKLLAKVIEQRNDE